VPVSDLVPAAVWAEGAPVPTIEYLTEQTASVPVRIWAARVIVPSVVDTPPVTQLAGVSVWAHRAVPPVMTLGKQIPGTVWAESAHLPSVQIAAPPALVPRAGDAWFVSSASVSVLVPVPAGIGPGLETSFSWSWAVVPGRPKAEIHICYLDDLELPITSWQARIRDGAPTYLSVVTGFHYVDEILARTGGQLKIYKGHRYLDESGGRRLVEIIDATLTSLRYDQGARNASVTLVGYVTTTYTTARTFALPDSVITYKSLQADGRRRLRSGVQIYGDDGWQEGGSTDFFIRPGDTVTFGPGGTDSLVVGYVSISVSPTQEIMEIVES